MGTRRPAGWSHPPGRRATAQAIAPARAAKWQEKSEAGGLGILSRPSARTAALSLALNWLEKATTPLAHCSTGCGGVMGGATGPSAAVAAGGRETAASIALIIVAPAGSCSWRAASAAFMKGDKKTPATAPASTGSAVNALVETLSAAGTGVGAAESEAVNAAAAVAARTKSEVALICGSPGVAAGGPGAGAGAPIGAAAAGRAQSPSGALLGLRLGLVTLLMACSGLKPIEFTLTWEERDESGGRHRGRLLVMVGVETLLCWRSIEPCSMSGIPCAKSQLSPCLQ